MQNNGYDFGAFNDFTDEVLQDLIEKLLEHVNNTSNPHHVTPADLGLGAIDNTSGSYTNDENVTFELFGPELDRYTYSSKNGFDYKAVSIPDKITSAADGI